MAARRKKHILCSALLVASALVMLFCVLLQGLVQADLQYVIPAPKDADAWASCYEQALDLQADLREEKIKVAIYGKAQHVTLYTEQGQTTVTLYAVDDGWREMYHETLFDGRMISCHDVERETACIVLNESTARTLFPAGNSLGSMVQINDTRYEVVGLIRDGNRLGESEAGIGFIPITSSMSEMDTIICSLQGDGLSGASAIYEKTLRQWQANGTFHDYSKIKWAAWMPFYGTAIAGLLLVLVRVLRLWKNWCTRLLCACRKNLAQHYLKDVLLPIAGRWLLMLCTGGIALAGVWLFLQCAILPMKIFTDWVPENPTSLASLSNSIQYILRLWSDGIVYHSRESNLMRMVSSFLVAAYALLATGPMLFLLKCKKCSIVN